MSSALIRVKKSLVFVIVLLSYFQCVVRDLAAYYKAFYIYKGFRVSSFFFAYSARSHYILGFEPCMVPFIVNQSISRGGSVVQLFHFCWILRMRTPRLF